MKSFLGGLLFGLSILVCPAAEKPNVLFIAIDDLNDWVGPLKGHPQAQTPHMDRLAARGTTFTNAHCQSPLCNASRTSLMLGLRPSTTGIYGLAPWFRTVDGLKDRVTLAQHFASQGYRTLSGGKIYHGGKGGREAEFDEWGPNASVGAKPEKKIVDTPAKHPLVDWGTFDHKDEDKGDWTVASWAVDALGKRAEKEDPFFMAVGFFLPHVPCYATQKWFDLYPEDTLQLPPYLDGDRSDLPKFASYLHWDLPETRLSWLRQNNQWRPLVRAYLASVSFVDSQVGRVLDALEASGKADNTVVVLWSDHGWHVGEKGITGKNTLWQDGTRVPLIFAGPGVGVGKRSHRPAELLDMYPTLSELCGLPARTDLEGHSLAPQLADPEAPREFPAITTHNHDNHSAANEDWRYIRYADGTEELYDLQSDPHEWTNVAHLEKHQPIKTKLATYLPKESAPPAPKSAHRILTYDGEKAIWEGQEIDQKSNILPGDVSVSDASAKIFPKGANPIELLKEGAGEGPAWHPQLGLLTSAGGDVHQLRSDGMASIFKANVGSNGLLFDRDGSLLVCEPKQRRVTRHHLNGDVTVLADAYQGKRFVSPNDIAVDSRGRIYFTDPCYGSRDGLEIMDDDSNPIEGVYRIDLDGKVTQIITHEVDRPNGVLVSADDKFLYVADNNNNTLGGARKLWRFDLRKNGSLRPDSRHLVYDWAETRGPDGMAQDTTGRLYVAAGIHHPKPPLEVAEQPTSGVYVLSPKGELLDFVAIPTDEVTNCSFGGPDWKTLYITAGGHLWSIATTTPGHVPLSAKDEKKPTFLYSRYFNAQGESRYLPDGSYRGILAELGKSLDVRVNSDAPSTTSLANVDVLLISNPSAEAVGDNPAPPRFSPSARQALLEYVYGGGGLIIMGNQENHNLETETTNLLLADFGMKWVDLYTDPKAIKLADETPIIGDLTWAYFTGNLIEMANNHPANPRSLVTNDVKQKPLKGERNQEGCLLAIAEPGKGRVVLITDSGWVNDSVLEGKGIGGVAIKDHDNAEIMTELLLWAAGIE